MSVAAQHTTVPTITVAPRGSQERVRVTPGRTRVRFTSVYSVVVDGHETQPYVTHREAQRDAARIRARIRRFDLQHVVPVAGPCAWPLSVVAWPGRAVILWGAMRVAEGARLGDFAAWKVLGPYVTHDLALIFQRVAAIESEIVDAMRQS